MSDVLYALDPFDERLLCEEALEVGELLPDGMTLVVGPSGSVAGRLGRVVEQRVFEASFGEHSPKMMEQEYGAWESVSLFITLVDHDGVVGCFRMIWSSDLSRPTKVEVDLDLTDGRARRHHCRTTDAPVWEVSTCVVVPERRRSLAVAWLMGEMLGQVRLRYSAPLFSVIVVPFFRTLRAIGFDVTPLAGLGAAEYLGAMSQPAQLPLTPYSNLVTRGPFLPTARAVRQRIDEPAVALDLTGADPLIDLTVSQVPRFPSDVIIREAAEQR